MLWTYSLGHRFRCKLVGSESPLLFSTSHAPRSSYCGWIRTIISAIFKVNLCPCRGWSGAARSSHAGIRRVLMTSCSAWCGSWGCLRGTAGSAYLGCYWPIGCISSYREGIGYWSAASCSYRLKATSCVWLALIARPRAQPSVLRCKGWSLKLPEWRFGSGWRSTRPAKDQRLGLVTAFSW